VGRKFDIITEADARRLPRGESVVLARGGHVTPLAADTLRERRIDVVFEDRVSAGDAALAPPASIRSIAIASDADGIALRRSLVSFLRSRGIAVVDLADGRDGLDFADSAALVAQVVARGEADAGVLIDATGIPGAVVANKVAGIRAAAASSETLGRLAREHAGANVLALGATLVTEQEARDIVAAWLGAAMRDPARIRGLGKIRDLERYARKES